MLFLAGQTAQDGTGRIVAPGDLVGQFRQALANVRVVLEARGGTPADLVKVTFYVRDKRDYRAKARAIGQVYQEALRGHYPATTLVEVSALWDDEALVEIDGIAVLD
jgi:enamine deaminase RidA (YjgF/YER057c/UK114 family)